MTPPPPPPLLVTFLTSFNGKICRKKSMIENFRANVLFHVLPCKSALNLPNGRFTRYDFVACDNGLRHAHDMIYDCCVRQKKCRSILKHVLKRCDNRKSCRRPVVSLSHATKIVKTSDLKRRPTDLKRRLCHLKRRPCELKRRPTSKCQKDAAYGWSDDVVCYGIMGAVEQLDVGSECVCSKLLTKKLYNMSTQCKVQLLVGYFFQRLQSVEPELTSSVYKAELEPRMSLDFK